MVVDAIDLVAIDEGVRNDFEAVCDTQALNAAEREYLARVVTGTTPGNRDRPLFVLANALSENIDQETKHPSADVDIARLVTPHAISGISLRRRHRALLDFLLSMDDFAHFSDIAGAVGDLGRGSIGIGDLANQFARLLHGYRVTCLPYARHRSAFLRVRRFLDAARPTDPHPRDGDSLAFWLEISSEDDRFMHETALGTFISYKSAQDIIAHRVEETAGAAKLHAPLDPTASIFDNSVDEEELDGPRIALERIVTSPLKIFQNKDLETIRHLVWLGRTGRDWTWSALADASFTPAQKILTQWLRSKKAITPETIASVVAARPDYESVHLRCNAIVELSRDVLHYTLDLVRAGKSVPEKSAVPSNAGVKPGGALRALLRRASFADLNDEQRRSELLAISDALATIMTMAEHAERHWGTSLKLSDNSRYQIDKLSVRDKLVRLYSKRTVPNRDYDDASRP